MLDDGASTACKTDFAGGQNDVAEEMHARLEGLEPRNMSNLDVKGEAPDQADELDPSVVRELWRRGSSLRAAGR